MTREELIRELEALIERAMRQDDTMPAAAVLSALLGALLVRSGVELMKLIVPFSESQIRTLRSRWN